ncbi:hypothetical protein TRICI_006754 [Trichomonascus ciferrii]|uniref:DUF202 domain-containing protein n=1 Tax=Trichomonascus ciferrii TaxID=44093 RepID=A0A642UE81_9ASCO|nr:hypothetical protein TRICI_006754 [Trichomonascus ciferrii]
MENDDRYDKGPSGGSENVSSTDVSSSTQVDVTDAEVDVEAQVPEQYYGEEDEVYYGEEYEDPRGGPHHRRNVSTESTQSGVRYSCDGEMSSTDEEAEDDRQEVSDRDFWTSVDRPAQQLDLNNISHVRFFCSNDFEPIIFDNITSEARDLDANERNYLSMIRTALYLSLAGCVVLTNFRFPGKPFDREDIIERMSLPVGIIFMVLSFIGLAASANNYMRTVTSYAKQRSVVQTTRTGQFFIIASACAIISTNIVLLVCM